ncbi:MAG: hypothetical protein QG572_217 [Pseudomonadota bacterium]|nr:hypothetical protein [Pseudomonadota bacterium]
MNYGLAQRPPRFASPRREFIGTMSKPLPSTGQSAPAKQPFRDIPGSFRPARWMAWLALTLGIGISLLGWRANLESSQRLADGRFEARTNEVHTAIEARLTAYTQILRSAQAYIGVTGHPRQSDWARLLNTLDIVHNYPGITGVIYLRPFNHTERQRIESEVRRDEPEFTIRPPGERDFYIALTAVEPRTPTTLMAIGSDSWTHPVRRETLAAARDSGLSRITPKLALVIDDPAKPLPAFLMYQAVYRNGTQPTTVEDRRAALLGYVGAAFRIDALMNDSEGKPPGDIALRVHDGFDEKNEAFHATHADFDFGKTTLQRTRTLSVGGHTWIINYAALPAFEDEVANQAASWRLLSGGLLVSLLLFTIVWSLATTHARAESMARRMTRSLRESETTLRALFEQAPIGIALIDHEGRIIDCNEQSAAHVGSTRDAIIGFSMLDDARDQSLREPLLRAIAGEAVTIEAAYAPTFGMRNSIYNWRFQPVEIDEERSFVLCFVEDISERKTAEARIEHLAHHDTLTGLANRSLLKDRLQQAIAVAARSRTQLALMFLDLDFFKHVNDTIGHSAGDAMLIEVAQRLRHCVRESDTLARIGGDEFVVLLTNIRDVQDSARVAETIIAAIAEPITLDTHVINTSASLGIAIWPDDGANEETLTSNADVAMYHAKSSGRNNYQFFTADMNLRAQEAAAMERSLRDALTHGQFRLDYQTQVDGETGTIIGAEALIRWQHPELGLLLPGKFIHIAEERGLIDRIGDWVLNTACMQAQAWHNAGHPRLQMAVNISPRQFRKGKLQESVTRALATSGLPPEFLALEITESVVMEDVDAATSMLGELRNLGVQIEIDDFGTGHSSLAYLKLLPIHRLKIDRSFVRDIPGDADDTAIVEAIIKLAGSLQLEIIAEGVETEEQRQFLLSKGCRAMQGYHFSRPVPAAEFEAQLGVAAKA